MNQSQHDISKNYQYFRGGQNNLSKLGFVTALMTVVSTVSVAQAGTIRGDRPDELYTNLAKEYPSVGQLLLGQSDPLGSNQLLNLFGCSGTLVSKTWVLTAAHCFESDTKSLIDAGVFNIGGQNYSVVGGVFKKEFRTLNRNFYAGVDIGLFKLDKPVTNVKPVKLNEEKNENGKAGTYVGFGRTGNGKEGAVKDAGTKRAGQNSIEIKPALSGVSGAKSYLLSDFDKPGCTLTNVQLGLCTLQDLQLNLEYATAKGDSGGGVFINIPGLTDPKVIGVISGGTLNSAYGSEFISTRVSNHTGWLKNVAKSFKLGQTKKINVPGGTITLPDNFKPLSENVSDLLLENPTLFDNLYQFEVSEDIYSDVFTGTDDPFETDIQAVPEPATVLGTLAFGILGGGFWKKRKGDKRA